MKLPTLYKKTSTGAIQFWDIEVYQADWSPDSGAKIHTRYGQVGTDSPQETVDLIKEGKNAGKKNATTALEQAEAEAKAKWEKQKKKGYVETKEAAEAGELDELIEGGIVPMLAHKFSEQAHKIKYPCAAQPKLDGIRCIAIVKDGQCTLWSRTRKPITSVPHIVQEIEAIFGHKDIVLDGELYNHELKADFEKIVSMVRQQEPAEGHEIVQYHIYDQFTDGAFEQRFVELGSVFSLNEPYYLKLVTTTILNNEDEVMIAFDKARALGYEGTMLRNTNSKYVNKRSYDLQKVKEFDDAEFPIVDVEEGRGKLAGHAIFVCTNELGKKFLAKMKGDTAKLKEYFENHDLWKGKKLTVQFQGLTGAEKVPRFPVGIAIRDYE
jgi:ATP-dependent DNA ligase